MHSEVFGYPNVMYVLDKGVVSYRKRVLLTGDTWGDDDLLLFAEDRLRTPLATTFLCHSRKRCVRYVTVLWNIGDSISTMYRSKRTVLRRDRPR